MLRKFKDGSAVITYETLWHKVEINLTSEENIESLIYEDTKITIIFTFSPEVIKLWYDFFTERGYELH
jgi:hypothetical protein